MKYQLSIKLLFVLPFSYGAPVVAEDMGKNLKTCLAGKYESLCKEDLLTKLQSKQLAIARTEIAKRSNSAAGAAASAAMRHCCTPGG